MGIKLILAHYIGEVMEASFYRCLGENKIRCFLCAHNCLIDDQGLGFCRVRRNNKSRLESLNYAKVAACGLDPVEKKPLYHFLPGKAVYSLACRGCNFRCDFCQNWQISQKDCAWEKKLPGDVVREALSSGAAAIAYTYTEPTIYFEFAYDCAVLARKKGLVNIFVTNGYMGREALERIGPYLGAANVDLKSFQDRFYEQYCQARLQPVLDTIKRMKKLGIWIEITTLIIPGRNDSSGELSDMAEFIASVDKNIPWHISRFYPAYQADDLAPTSVPTIERAYKIGKEKGLNFIYPGNIDIGCGRDTICPNCAAAVIRRKGFIVYENKIEGNRCGFCRHPIAGVFVRPQID